MPFKHRDNKKREHSFKRGRGGRNFHDKKSFGNIRPKFEKTEYRHQDQLTEDEAGISQYISDLEGYSAVIKARYSDFQVSEINLEGKIAKLTDRSIPKDFVPQIQKFSFEDFEQSPIEEIPQETWEAMRNMVKNSTDETIELNVENLSKDERKTLHHSVKRYFGQKIVASTVTKDNKTVLEFKKYNKEVAKNIIQWPEDKPEFVHFIVYKQLLDTMDVCLKISQALRIPPMKVTYAGVKDRRAKTTQWFCIKKVLPWKLLTKTRQMKSIKIGNLEFKDKSLKIGDLSGNRFRIALRNVIADDELITKTLEHAKEHGFINYYGLQRFGNDKEVPTYLIGVKLLKGEWEEAVNLILKVKTADDPTLDLTKAKKLYARTKNAADALKLLEKSQQMYLESKLLQGLAENDKNDYVNALEKIPRNMRLMYIHSFQGLIFNKMASKRIEKFGLKPVESDLVFDDSVKEKQPVIVDDDNDNDDTEDADESKEKPAVRALKADELGKYTIYDIVLPLPGYDIVYPENMEQYYKEAIEEYGLNLDMPKQRVKTYNLSGDYRKIVGRVKDFEWKIMYYNNPTDDLIRSDIGEIHGDPEPESVENGTYKAVVMAFTLEPSSYATMVLREILKCNTSSSVQAQLNNYEKTVVEKSKILLESDSEKVAKETEESTDGIQPGSLLADKQKYEDFKNSILGESFSKRQAENGEGDGAGDCKKLRTDDL